MLSNFIRYHPFILHNFPEVWDLNGFSKSLILNIFRKSSLLTTVRFPRDLVHKSSFLLIFASVTSLGTHALRIKGGVVILFRNQ